MTCPRTPTCSPTCTPTCGRADARMHTCVYGWYLLAWKWAMVLKHIWQSVYLMKNLKFTSKVKGDIEMLTMFTSISWMRLRGLGIDGDTQSNFNDLSMPQACWWCQSLSNNYIRFFLKQWRALLSFNLTYSLAKRKTLLIWMYGDKGANKLSSS